MVTKTVPLPVSAIPETVVEEKPSVIIDKILGEGDVFLHVKGDLEYLLPDQEEYLAKLKDARGIPQDINNVPPDDPILDVIEQLPEVTSLPVRTRKEQEERNKTVRNILQNYYARLENEAAKGAIMLALTIEPDNVFPDEPAPYIAPEVRTRPGLITLPQPTPDLKHPVERRLKQIVDRIVRIPGALKEMQEAVELMSIDVRRRLQVRDKDTFRSK